MYNGMCLKSLNHKNIKCCKLAVVKHMISIFDVPVWSLSIDFLEDKLYNKREIPDKRILTSQRLIFKSQINEH